MASTSDWERVLAPHHDPGHLARLISRFEQAGVTPEQLSALLPDDSFLKASGWNELGNNVAIALVAEEARARLTDLAAAASSVRYNAIAEEARTRSIVEIAGELGISRQAVSRMANHVYHSSAEGPVQRLAGGRE